MLFAGSARTVQQVQQSTNTIVKHKLIHVLNYLLYLTVVESYESRYLQCVPFWIFGCVLMSSLTIIIILLSLIP